MALISYIDYTTIESATVTGTNWEPALPVGNTVSYDLGQPARSTQTNMSISVGFATTKQVGVFYIPKHTLSPKASWRIRASNNPLLLTSPSVVPSNEIIYDSNTGVVIPTTLSTTLIQVLSPPSSIYVQDNLAFNIGDPVHISSGVNYIDATVTSFDNLTKELGISVLSSSGISFSSATWVVTKPFALTRIWSLIAGFGVETWGQFSWDGVEYITSDSLSRAPAIHLLDEEISAQYFIIEISDPDNLDTYVDIHKLGMGPAWRTSIDISKGYSINLEDKSSLSRSMGGQAYLNIHPQYRKFKVSFKGLPRVELYNNLLEIDKLLGTGVPLLLCLDPEDTINLGNKSVYGSTAVSSIAKERLQDFMEKPLIIEEWI